MKYRYAALAAAAGLALLTGCGGSPAAAPTSSPSAAPSLTPVPSPTPEADVPVRPALGELVLTIDSLGPVSLGQAPPETDPDVDLFVYDDDYCTLTEEVTGTWVPTYPFGPSAFKDDYPPISIEVREGIVEEVAVFSSEPVTEQGIHVGSTLDDLLTAYPDAINAAPERAPNTAAYVIEGETSRLVMELALGEYGAASGLFDEVVSMRVEPLTQPFRIHVAGERAYPTCPTNM